MVAVVVVVIMGPVVQLGLAHVLRGMFYSSVVANRCQRSVYNMGGGSRCASRPFQELEKAGGVDLISPQKTIWSKKMKLLRTGWMKKKKSYGLGTPRESCKRKRPFFFPTILV